ncbi:esterase/lipase family protein [Flammeovirga aprica]|uniref:GPI inositol-deacylase PGAP1-like alpha/beta domain-containing protein n=1 Tax=Flammeovirga aprica JL-4 TaxID=694437 RepID=A0A7X9S0C6_9BACT|nr:hypothetical protein [Flammeovirga aprica]NME72090.1 hypothetical protein [Flammeovirga aprica JL-4]
MTKYIYTLFFTLSFSFTSFSQGVSSEEIEQGVADYISYFDSVNLQTNYLLNLSFQGVEDFEKFSPVDNQSHHYVFSSSNEWKRLYYKVKNAEKSQSTVLDLQETISNTITKSNQIPIGLIDVHGDYVYDNGFELYFNATTQKLYDNVTADKKHIYGVSNLISSVDDLTVEFLIHSSFLLKDNSHYSTVAIDFDNGTGYKTYTLNNQTISINYSSGGEKNIRFKVVKNNEEYISYSTLVVNDYSDIVIEKVQPITSQITPENSNGRVTHVEVQGGEIHFFLDNEDDFDKPVLIVEGFDPSGTTTPQRLFGKYAASENWVDMLNAGYDIAVLTFDENWDDLRDNAQVLKDAIRFLNEDKNGDHDIIIIGESMGGIITRIALKEMEDDGIDHHVSLYISHDSPHKGANIPLGIQTLAKSITEAEQDSKIARYLIDLLSSEGIDELKGILNSATSTAGRQMLIRNFSHLNSIDNEYTNFQQFLNNLGWPSQSRNISIINGSNDFESQLKHFQFPNRGFQQLGDDYINLDFGRKWYNFLGAVVNAKVSPIGQQNYQVSRLYLKVAFIDIVNYRRHANFNYNSPLDLLPGAVSRNDLINGYCFVPTVSSLASTNDMLNNSARYIEDQRMWSKRTLIGDGSIPFDNVYSPAENTNHTFINQRNEDLMDISMNEIWGLVLQQEVMVNEGFLQNKTINGEWAFSTNTSIEAGRFAMPDEWGNHPNSANDKLEDIGDFVVKSGSNIRLTTEGQVTNCV